MARPLMRHSPDCVGDDAARVLITPTRPRPPARQYGIARCLDCCAVDVVELVARPAGDVSRETVAGRPVFPVDDRP